MCFTSTSLEFHLRRVPHRSPHHTTAEAGAHRSQDGFRLIQKDRREDGLWYGRWRSDVRQM